MTKIALVGKDSTVEPLGLMYLSAYLKERGDEPKIYLIDGVFDKTDLALELSKENDEFWLSAYTGYHRRMYGLASHLKAIDAGPICIGGPHNYFFQTASSNYCTYSHKGHITSVDKLPIPDREGFYEVSPKHRNSPIKSIMASFGCPYQCTYCYNSTLKQKPYLRPVEDVAKEAEGLEAKLIFFEDDCFAFDMDWLKALGKVWPGKPFHCQLRPELATKDRMNLLYAIGCHSVTMAIECANESVRKKLLKRNYTDDDIDWAVHNIRQCNMKLRIEQMLGLPGTNLEDELKLLQLNVDFEPEMAWSSIFIPYRGTWLAEWCVQEGLYTGNNDDVPESFFDKCIMNYSPERINEIETLQRIWTSCARMKDGVKVAQACIRGEEFLSAVRKTAYEDLYETKGV